MSSRTTPRLAALAGVLAIAGTLLLASASAARDSADLSPDVSVILDGASYGDEDVAIHDLASGTVSADDLGALPYASDVDAYHLLSNGDQLFSLDTTVSLPGGITAGPEDVVRYDGSLYSIEFDGTAEGVPDGAQVDAVTMNGADLALSFDTTVQLGGTTFADEDLVGFDGVAFTSLFDGSADGIDPALDLDGAHVFAGTGNLGLSFDGSGVVAGVSYNDEDVLGYTAPGPGWWIEWDGDNEHPEWAAADVDAVHFVPEPGELTLLGAGFGGLAWLRRRRCRG